MKNLDELENKWSELYHKRRELQKLENKWSELYHKRRKLQEEVDRINAEMNKILCEIDNLPLDNSENL